VAALLATGAFLNRAGAADVGGHHHLQATGHLTLMARRAAMGRYGPSDEYSPTPGYNPSPGYSLPDQYGPRLAYGPPSAYGPPPRYNSSDDYGPAPGYLADDDGPQSDYGPTLRPPRAIPYAVLPRSLAVRPACDRQWRCGPRGCGWRQVCYPAQPWAEHYARPYRGFADRGYGPPPGSGYYGPN
jgi:hypothetical protein